jgi:bla regulator protein BlaR1
MIASFSELSSAVIRAFGWTLVHSLWQGTAIALVLFAILARTRRAQTRYWLAYGALVVQFLAACVTFTLVYEPGVASVPVAMPAAGVAFDATLVLTQSDAVSRAPGFMLADWLDRYSPVIAALWALGLFVSVFRLAGGLRYLYRLRHHSLPCADPWWSGRVATLARQLGLKRSVGLLESALVHLPMTMGFLKPVILLPIGLVNQLSPAEVEAVLAHELAHVARRDWLFNLLQACLEALFYFHPAVWWIASIIRRERENCCDDTAVALTGSALAYVKTLVRLQEQPRRAPTPALALGFSGVRAALLTRRKPGLGLLLERVQRILNQTTPSATSPMEKAIATILLLALLSLWTVRSDSAPQLKAAVLDAAEQPLEWIGLTPSEAAETSHLVALADTVAPRAKTRRQETIMQDDGSQRVELHIENDQVTELRIDGKEVPSAQYGEHQELIDRLRYEIAVPAAPAAPGLPALPAHPGIPAEAGEPADVPEPADAPFPPMPPSRITTEKDANGNTVLRIDGPGKNKEFLIKDGEIWVDGRKLSPGESIELNNGEAFGYWFNDGDFAAFRQPFTADQLQGFQFDAQRELEVYSDFRNGEPLTKEQRKQVEKEMKRAHKEMERAHKELKRSTKDLERMPLERDMKYHLEAEAERARAEAHDAQAAAMRAHGDARRAQAEALRAHKDAERESQAVNALRRQLSQDRLISNDQNFSFELSAKEMRVNGKTQPADVHRRYLDLYRKETGHEMNGSARIEILEEN